MNKIPLETIGEESEIRFRDCFSVRYIQSAALLCRLGYAIEKDFAKSGQVSTESVLSHEAFILNSVLSTVAFLESTINELYSDVVDNAYLSLDERGEALLHSISDGWRNEKNFDRAPVLTKYQKILSIAGIPQFPETDPAFLNVKNVIEIRNFLMHYRREWVVLSKKKVAAGGQETRGEKFERDLRHAFRENPLAHVSRPFFPDKCLGHGCAEWAIINSLIVTDEFFSRLGFAAPYEGIRKELLTR
ncbi:MAG: hypothetical protein A4E35_01627 [Methanoregula sp. PtaU1.Bin051]|nr:MAG: hypothetical protein A4E35_01627 [Methanoregula sp. PtaU1.Bin051]